MRSLLLLTTVLALTSQGALADERQAERQTALLASSCANCHGTDGRGTMTLAAIAGRPASILESQLLAFKHDESAGATVMDRIAQGYSDDELKALADYFANQPEL
ncbi:c-type cytochrome [Marinimicrobium alkaliphilum]|uniref:c-type cytochrome n=1 Tax=Marinimicrobium alkaliphilum TaxID=2202654 RepID=UPI0018E09963|nr:c-type cytochrome [Marinimicrobium alkaliphilum]